MQAFTLQYVLNGWLIDWTKWDATHTVDQNLQISVASVSSHDWALTFHALHKQQVAQQRRRDALSVAVLLTAAQQYKNTSERACNNQMTLKNIQGHRNCRYSIYNFLLVVCRNIILFLHHFWDSTAFTVHVTLSNYSLSVRQLNYKPGMLSDPCLHIL